MPKGHSLRLTAAAAAELGRQAAVAGTPGLMHLDLVEGGCEQWTIRLRPGHLAGVPIARADGVNLYAPGEQVTLLAGLSLDYRGDLSGGGFLVRSSNGLKSCACGAAFSRQTSGGGGQATQ
jgi:Fe-S cluster assembly iron-binding protein IscA